MLDWFQVQLGTLDPLRIASARRKATQFFEQVETYLESASLSPEDWPDAEEDNDFWRHDGEEDDDFLRYDDAEGET